MEGDAVTSRLTSEAATDTSDATALSSPSSNIRDGSAGAEPSAEAGPPDTGGSTDAAATAPPAGARAGSRLSRKSSSVLAAVLVLLAGGIATGGYFALRSHERMQAISGANAEALAAAKDCVAATQPPDATALADSQRKLDQCSTGDFGTQAMYYSAILAEAYQAVNVRVKIPEMHAAVERNNDDGSIDALVAFRAKISQDGMADRENSYRVRVKIVSENGQYKVAQLDQVAS